MCLGEEISQIDEFAVVLVFDVYHTPAVVAASYIPTIDGDGLFAADNREWNE